MNFTKKYYKDSPIILGLAGKAATGKTSVAHSIVPQGAVKTFSESIVWDHIFFALPLYELASIKKTALGVRQKDRQLFAIHQAVYDIFGGNALGSIPSYDDFVNLVTDIYDLPIEPEGVKPRSFLQKAGDLCRNFDADCFAKWGIIKAFKLYRQYINSDIFTENENPMCIIISDVRFENEADAILKQPNGIVICYDASDEVRNSRLIKRDGSLMTLEQSSHKSEQQIDLIKSKATAIIDTDNLSVEEQTNKTIDIINSFMRVYA